LADALTVLEGHCRMADPEPVALRLARHAGGIVLDLGTADGRCVVVDASGWRAEVRSPLVFRRTALTSPLPDPLRGGDLDRLRDLLNVDDDGWHLLVGWTVAALIPELPHPILALLGEQGTAKSTAAKLLVELIDPSPAPLRSCPRDIRQWAVTASASWTVALDNVSSVPPWLSDTLCKAVTGDGIVDRALYTDDDVSVLSFRRVVAMTSIDAGALAGDLAERLLPVELDRIPDGNRRTDDEVAEAFSGARALLLGALLDLLARVLDALPRVRLAELPRMADFARVLAAIEAVLGWDSLKAYKQATQDVAENVVESDPFAEAVRTLAGDGWTGTASELLDQLTPERPPRGWPRSARAVAGALRRLVPALRSTGVEVSFERETGGNRTRTISLARRDGGDANDTPTTVQVITEDDQSDETSEEGRDLPSQPSQPSPFAPDQRKRRDDRRDANPDRDANPLPRRDGRDAKDGRDGHSHSLSGRAPEPEHDDCGHESIRARDGRCVTCIVEKHKEPAQTRLCLGCGQPLPPGTPSDVVGHGDPYCLDRLPAWAS